MYFISEASSKSSKLAPPDALAAIARAVAGRIGRATRSHRSAESGAGRGKTSAKVRAPVVQPAGADGPGGTAALVIVGTACTQHVRLRTKSCKASAVQELIQSCTKEKAHQPVQPAGPGFRRRWRNNTPYPRFTGVFLPLSALSPAMWPGAYDGGGAVRAVVSYLLRCRHVVW